MKKLSLYFARPGEVRIEDEECEGPGPGQVRVRTRVSAISAGTEMLFYRGQVPPGMRADETIEGLKAPAAYPLKYGYACAGEVETLGLGVPAQWQGKRVLALHPHESRFSMQPEDLVPVPDTVSLEDAVFLPLMETAVNFVLDGNPSIGEQVVVFGQGLTGLLTTALLARFPLEKLVTLDPADLRRERSREIGAHESLDPGAPGVSETLRGLLAGCRPGGGADLTYELSGNPAALDQALSATGFNGRVIIGSWYGRKQAPLDLGGDFHRSRIRMKSSQVSTIDPEQAGRWTRARRFHTALAMIKAIRPSALVTHRFRLRDAEAAYHLLDNHAEEALQVLLAYE
ncbi:MAG: zinc-dependent alcohol dehydrogenase [Endomicrobiales bacterium]